MAVDYFRSEAEARAGEAKSIPDDLVAGFGEWQLLVAEPEWFDLTDPWLVTPMSCIVSLLRRENRLIPRPSAKAM